MPNVEKRETPQERAARVRRGLPSYLKDPATEAANGQAQAALRASFTRARLNDGERLLARGVQMEEVARAHIRTMEAHREEGHTVSTRGGANKDMLAEQNVVLAIALELQGRYEEAAAVHPMRREQKRLLAVHEAVGRNDELCDCPRDEPIDPLTKKTSGNEVRLSISPRRNLKTIYSRKHGGAVSLMRCDSCGHLNARPLTGQAAEIEGVRREARAAVEAGRAVRPDVQVLGAVK
jgi:hypothetical protein